MGGGGGGRPPPPHKTWEFDVFPYLKGNTDADTLFPQSEGSSLRSNEDTDKLLGTGDGKAFQF